MRPYFSLTHVTAGFVAVMIGFTSSIVLIFQAANMAGANTAEMSSWIFALGFGIAISCIGLSLYYRMPILIGWSTSGAALLATNLAGHTMPEAIGAFILAAALSTIMGLTGLVERLIKHIPKELASAMVAGVLLPFGIHVFTAMQDQFALVMGMLLIYLIGKAAFPKYVMIFVLLIGMCIVKMENLASFEDIHLHLTHPILTLPSFSFSAFFNIAIPLFVVTMTSQNVPGIAILNAAGFKPPVSPIITWTSMINLLLAPLGCYSICLTALTAAICANSESDLNPRKRYKATLFAGLCWLCVGLLGASIVSLFLSLPKAFIAALAGIALFGAISHNLQTSLESEKHRESALLTILVSSSGISLFGIGAAFWGLLIGVFAYGALNGFKKEPLLELQPKTD